MHVFISMWDIPVLLCLPQIGKDARDCILFWECMAWYTVHLASSLTCPEKSLVGGIHKPWLNQQSTLNWTFIYDDLTSPSPCVFPFRLCDFGAQVVFITWRARNIPKPELAYSWRVVLSLLGLHQSAGFPQHWRHISSYNWKIDLIYIPLCQSLNSVLLTERSGQQGDGLVLKKDTP